ncbi:hypothetical protein ACNKHU_19830 [Shigella flexneri]
MRSGSEVGFPQSLGEVHDMLYDKSLERDNCGFGLIAHIEGEPSHKVVRLQSRTGPHAAPWRDSRRW